MASFTVGKPIDKNASEEDALYPIFRNGDPIGEPIKGKAAAASHAAYLELKELFVYLRKRKMISEIAYNRSLNSSKDYFYRLRQQRRTGIVSHKIRSNVIELSPK